MDTREKKWTGNPAGLLMMPVLSYVLCEFVAGNLTGITWPFALLNIGWYYVLYTVLFVLCGRSRIAVPVMSSVLYVIALAETFVVGFRERPVMLWDVMAARTAMSVSANYAFSISWKMVISALILLAANVTLWRKPVRIKGLQCRLAVGAGGVAAAAVFVLSFFLYFVPSMDLQVKMWAVNESYSEYGFLLATAASIKDMVKRPPEGYSIERVEAILAEAESEREGKTDRETEGISGTDPVQPVNLICIMNESLADIRLAGAFSTNEEYFPFIDSLRENTIRGNLCMPVFGAMTSNSEFEFLTGDSMALLPSGSIAYQFYVKPDARTMVSTVKDQGYETVAMHPYPGKNWNREACYKNMGFDTFLDGEFYEGCEELRKYVSDRADYEKLIQVVEAKKDPKDKLFIFNVTMQNHGGYEGTYDNFSQEVHLTGDHEGKYPKADQYLSLMKRSDEAFRYLLEYFEASDEPTMIVMFGDHLPSLEAEFFDNINGGVRKYPSPSGYLKWFRTPFLIWTNYEQPAQDMGDMGAVYLSSQVLNAANLELSPYDSFMLRMAEALPVIHITGCYDREGNFLTWEEAEAEGSSVRDMLLDYEALVYNHSLDRQKIREMFSLPPSGWTCKKL